jgi:hypothetical protein
VPLYINPFKGSSKGMLMHRDPKSAADMLAPMRPKRDYCNHDAKVKVVTRQKDQLAE